jgi:hypothetical protein
MERKHLLIALVAALAVTLAGTQTQGVMAHRHYGDYGQYYQPFGTHNRFDDSNNIKNTDEENAQKTNCDDKSVCNTSNVQVTGNGNVVLVNQAGATSGGDTRDYGSGY